MTATTLERPRLLPGVNRWVLVILMTLAAAASLRIFDSLRVQQLAIDFDPMWAGARAAMTDPSRIYDFRYITELQHWPLGHSIRPFIYPPTALLLFGPLALLPCRLAYWIWTGVTGGFFLWAGIKAKAPWWFILLPSVALVADTGQITFLIGALTLTAFNTEGEEPLVAGLLFGVAAALKPQLMMLLPVALAAEGRWRTLFATGATGAALCALSAALFGVQTWIDWMHALPRFALMVFHSHSLVAHAVSPYAAFVAMGQNGAWAYAFAPLAFLLVWFAFRKPSDVHAQMIALFGGALMVTPYAMNYELALFAPAMGAYLARTESRPWPGFAAAGLVYIAPLGPPVGPLLASLSLAAQTVLARLPLWRSSSNPNPQALY